MLPFRELGSSPDQIRGDRGHHSAANVSVSPTAPAAESIAAASA